MQHKLQVVSTAMILFKLTCSEHGKLKCGSWAASRTCILMFWQCSWKRISQAGTGVLAKQAAVFIICLASGAHDIPIQSKADQAGRGAERVIMLIHFAWRTAALVQLLAARERPLQHHMPICVMRVHFEGVQACLCWQVLVLWLCQAAPSLHAHMHFVS